MTCCSIGTFVAENAQTDRASNVSDKALQVRLEPRCTLLQVS